MFWKTYELEGNVYLKDTTIVLAKMNPSGCIDTTRHIVKFTNEIAFSLNATYSCPNKNDANIGLELLSSDTYKYYINGAEAELTGASFKNFGAGNYLIEIVDQYGCKASESIQIIDKQAVEYELVANDISCIDGFTVLKVKLKNYTESQVTIKWSNGISGVENKITSGGNYTVEISNGCTNISEPFDIKGPVSTNLFKKYIVCSGNKLDLLDKTFSRDTIVYRTVVNALGCVDSTTYDLQFGQKFNYILDITGSCPDKNDGKIFIDMKTQR
ncbi:MAG: hypothetical protein IPO92_18190 [Saprospiraceae bacterium]|nr:hypothetical protein [Saprospiraceae bacterium]